MDACRLACACAALVVPLCVAACGDASEGNPRVVLDEASCTYEGDKTPKTPSFTMEIDNQVASFSYFEVDRIPADVTNEQAEAFFEGAEVAVEQGGSFAGAPATWRLNRRAGIQGSSTGSMLVGDPEFPDQMLVAGQRYVVWCSTGEPVTAVHFATVIEPTD